MRLRIEIRRPDVCQSLHPQQGNRSRGTSSNIVTFDLAIKPCESEIEISEIATIGD